MSVAQIAEKAQNYEYNPLIPLKYWLRTAATILKEVHFLTPILVPKLNSVL